MEPSLESKTTWNTPTATVSPFHVAPNEPKPLALERMYAVGCGMTPYAYIPGFVGASPRKKTLFNAGASNPPSTKVTLAGIVIDSSEATSLKAPSPIEVTVEGIETEVREVAPENVQLAIDVTPAGIVTEESEVAPAKAALWIVVTVDGIETEVKLADPENAYSPMVVTPNGTENELPVFPAGN